jgi:hypothetical protein
VGSVGQFRALGGCTGIAICTNLFNNHISKSLGSVLTPSQLSSLLKSTETIKNLPPPGQIAARQACADGYNLQMRAMAVLAGATLLSSFLLFEKKPRRQMLYIISGRFRENTLDSRV